MSDLVYRSYLFSRDEFLVLSAYIGMETLHILFENKAEPLDRKKINLVIFQLYQKEILRWEKENFYELKSEIKELFRKMKDSRWELQVYSEKKGSPLLCFLNQDVIVTELSENDKDRIRIYCLSKEAFLKELYDRGILPEQNFRNSGFLEEEIPTNWSILLENCRVWLEDGQDLHENLRKLLWEEEDLLAFATVFNREDGTYEEAVLVLKGERQDCLGRVKRDSVQTEYDTEECIKKFLKERE